MWEDAYSYIAEFTGALALAANGRRTIAVDIDREGDFALRRIAQVATSFNYRVALTDQEDRLFIGAPGTIETPAVNMFGTGQLPHELTAARVFRRTNQLRVSLTDASGAPNTVRVLLTGAQMFPAPPFQIPRFREAEPYALILNFGAETTDDAAQIAANGTGEFSRRVPGDSWFEVHSLALSTTGAATVQLLTNAFREWFRRPVHSDLLGGTSFLGAFQGVGAPIAPTSAWPFRFTPPKLLPSNAILTARVADLSAALNSVRLTVHGIRRYL